MAAYALGALAAPGVREALAGALEDRAPDVAWNAALSLARLGDPAGLPLLDRLLERPYLDAVRSPDPLGHPTPLPEDRKEEIMIAALRAVAELGGEERRPAIEAIAAADPSLAVRQAALETLRAMEGGNR
jgi:HEAT repeat protein